jgi:hypothetical protein
MSVRPTLQITDRTPSAFSVVIRINGLFRPQISGLRVSPSPASLLLWALELQTWAGIAWSTDGRALFGFLVCFAMYLELLVFQCNSWWNDFRQRCPFCLQSLVLPITEGSSDRFRLNSATSESICPHGDGVLVENQTRWSSKFRSQLSSSHGLIHG